MHLLREPAVSRKPIACTEGNQKIVTAKRAADADGEDGEQEVKDGEAGGVDVATAVAETEHTVEDGAEGEADEGAEGALPEDGEEEPIFDRTAGCGVCEGEEADVKEGKAYAVVAAYKIPSMTMVVTKRAVA